ncbi:muscarinic acetylcholine receptor M2-like [Amphiura filiformis]|uniref:muscarinic acetylcholine receptor M2-like n=1 Tax=Amphiura filiformis TaxID=82378 RepID=UPI003B227EB5
METTTPSEMDTEFTGSSLSIRIILTTIVTITSFLTITGNIIIVYSYFTTRALQTYTNYYILNLAILDLIGGLFPMPMYGTYWILGYWPLSVPMCDFYLWVNHTTINATSFAVLIIAIDRYRSVVYPIQHFKQRNLKHALFWISTCIIIPLIIWTPTIFIWPAIGGRTFPPHICQPEYTNSLVFSAFAQLGLFWIPIITMAVLYAKVYRVYKKRIGTKNTKQREKKTQKEASSSGVETAISTNITTSRSEEGSSAAGTLEIDNQQSKKENKPEIESPRIKKENRTAVRTLSFIFAVHLASGLPWGILVILFKMCPSCIPLALYQTSVYAARISSLLNPVCYAAANTLYGDAFSRLLCYWKCRKS